MSVNAIESVKEGQIGEGQNQTLEGILNQPISLDTDVMDFFLVAGWKYLSSPTYRVADGNLKQELIKHVKKRRGKLTRSIKNLETRFYNCCDSRIGYGERFKTIGELKNIFLEHGLNFRDFGYASLAHFNDTLQEYSIEPFKVGGFYYPPKTLGRYGLESAGRRLHD